MSGRLLVGDCRAMLATLPDASAHACITSPPYYGLRAYGTNPQVWGGDDPACDHDFPIAAPAPKHEVRARPELDGCLSWGERDATTTSGAGAHCTRCQAWKGELGSEPTPEQFVSNLVAVFREVKRVLHPSGICLVNLGDSYAGSGTTLLVADRLGRDAIGIELSPEYAAMAEARIAGDAPLLNGLSEHEIEPIADKQGALGKRTYTGFNARWKAKQDGMAEVDTVAGDYAPLGLFEEAT